MLIILFGLSGSGKTFIGNILAKKFLYYFWDSDANLSDEMKNSIFAKKPFTQNMRDDVTEKTIERIKILQQQYKNIVVSNALYKEKNRCQLQKEFPDALFVYVQSNVNIILERIKSRANHVDEDYAKKIAVNFDEPKLKHKTIINIGTETEIINQLKVVLVS